MKKFILRSLLFCLAPVPILYLLSYMVDTGLRRSRHTYYAQWNDLLSGNINADVVILGSSRAWRHVSPAILDSVLHINSYNLGLSAASLSLQFARFKIYLAHNRKPKYLLQEISYTSFGKAEGIPGIQQLLPYLHDSSVWNIVTANGNALGPLDRYFPLYKYRGDMPLVVEGIRSYLGKGVTSNRYKGYEGQDVPWDSSFHNFKQNHRLGALYPVDSAATAAFRDLLTYCRANDIKVILFYAPQYAGLLPYISGKEEKQAIIDSFAKEYHVPLYNYLHDSLYRGTTYFYNSMHLNKTGAELFSHEFATDLKSDIH